MAIREGEGRKKAKKEGRNLIKLAKSTKEISLLNGDLIMRDNLILALFHFLSHFTGSVELKRWKELSSY